MNVVVSYKQKEIIDNANIDAIKDLNGLFNVDDLIDKFKNYFFSKMILDATSVENFATRDVLTKLADGIGADRLIILLPKTPLPPDEFKRLLIDLKIYNFSNDIDDIVKFIDTPNTYENAMATLSDNMDNYGYVDNSISDFKDLNDDHNEQNEDDSINDAFTNNMDNESLNNVDNLLNNDQSSYNNSTKLNDILNSFSVTNTDNSNYEDVSNSNDSFNSDLEYKDSQEINSFDNINSSFKSDSDAYINQSNNVNIQNEEKSLTFEDNNHIDGNSHVFLNIDEFSKLNNQTSDMKKIIGFKNITLHAGSTSLIYMLLKTVVDNLKKDALAIEINKNDFKLFISKRMVSVSENEIVNYLSTREENLIFVDLNDCKDTSFCDEVIYLLEPSIIMLNRLMIENLEIFKTLSDKKVVLNKSLLTENDIRTLSSEAGITFLFNIEPVNDRINNDVILKFLDILNIK